MGACTEPGHLAIVTELMDTNLGSLLRNSKVKISIYDKLQMAKEIAQGGNWLHLSKPAIVHRDLKPANILIDKYGRIKLCDFGLSSISKEASTVLKDHEGAPGTVCPPEISIDSQVAHIYVARGAGRERIQRRQD